MQFRTIVEAARDSAKEELKMTNAVQLEAQPLNRGRPTKFTPERIHQICNLVERGKSRDEIAEIIGVTTGTLQVTCSKLGISLRRPRFDIGTSLLPRQQPQYQNNAPPTRSGLPEGSEPESAKEPGAMQTGEAQAGAPPAGAWHRKPNDGGAAVFAIRMEYKGQERSTGLPLDEEMISQLAMEAEIRGMRIGELVAALILEIVKKDLFQPIRDDATCAHVQTAKETLPSSTEGPSTGPFER
jgi:hypothetical protein